MVFLVSNPVSYGYLKGSFKLVNTIVKKLESDYKKFVEKTDDEEKRTKETQDNRARLSALIGHTVTDADGGYFNVVIPNPEPTYTFQITILQFSEYTPTGEDATKYQIKGLSGRFSFESFMKILNISLTEGGRHS